MAGPPLAEYAVLWNTPPNVRALVPRVFSDMALLYPLTAVDEPNDQVRLFIMDTFARQPAMITPDLLNDLYNQLDRTGALQMDGTYMYLRRLIPLVANRLLVLAQGPAAPGAGGPPGGMDGGRRRKTGRRRNTRSRR